MQFLHNHFTSITQVIIEICTFGKEITHLKLLK